MEQTEEIVSILDANPDTVKVHFEALVPVHVSFEDFWRYFFRSDVNRIVQVRTANEDRIHSARKTRMGTVAKIDKLLQSAIAWVCQEAEFEAEFRMAMEEIYLAPILKPQQEVEEKKEIDANETSVFLASFDITEKTALLKKHPDTLKARFEELVPVQVSYQDFWQRFFFRYDVDRIIRVWTAKDERIRVARKEPMEAWNKIQVTPATFMTTTMNTTSVSTSKKLDSKAIALEVAKNSFDVMKKDILSVREEIAASRHKMLALRAKLDATRKGLAIAKRRVRSVKTCLSIAQDSLQCKEQEDKGEIPEATNVHLSSETADLTDSENASVDNSLSSSKVRDIPGITESVYMSEADTEMRSVLRKAAPGESTS
jgi:BSD domain